VGGHCIKPDDPSAVSAVDWPDVELWGLCFVSVKQEQDIVREKKKAFNVEAH